MDGDDRILAVPSAFYGQTTGMIEGYFRDFGTGEPLAGAQVVVEGKRIGNISNTDGYYFVINVPAGLWNIHVQLPGYRPGYDRRRTGDGDTLDRGI